MRNCSSPHWIEDTGLWKYLPKKKYNRVFGTVLKFQKLIMSMSTGASGESSSKLEEDKAKKRWGNF